MFCMWEHCVPLSALSEPLITIKIFPLALLSVAFLSSPKGAQKIDNSQNSTQKQVVQVLNG